MLRPEAPRIYNAVMDVVFRVCGQRLDGKCRAGKRPFKNASSTPGK
jgi:hypothetical protein